MELSRLRFAATAWKLLSSMAATICAACVRDSPASAALREPSDSMRCSMPTKLLATSVAVVFLLIHPASAGGSPAPGDDWATPSLPACRAVNETRTAMPVWKPDVTRDAKISSTPPQGVMYVDQVASFDVPACNGVEDGDFL